MDVRQPGDANAAEPTESTSWLIEREWRETNQVIRIRVDTRYRTDVMFDGKGSMDGARALIDLVDAVRDQVGHHIQITALVDMRRLDGAPLRAQFLIGKWLLQRKRQIDKVALFGGKPFEMGLGRAVMTIAGMGSKAWFGSSPAQALEFLGWPRERYPS